MRRAGGEGVAKKLFFHADSRDIVRPGHAKHLPLRHLQSTLKPMLAGGRARPEAPKQLGNQKVVSPSCNWPIPASAPHFARSHQTPKTALARVQLAPEMAEPVAATADPHMDLQQQLDSLRAEAARQQLEAEQTLHDLTAKLTSAESDVEAVRREYSSLQARLEEERGRREEAERQATLAAEGKKGDSAKEVEFRLKLEQADKEKRELLETLEREQRERANVEGESSRPLLS